jgi:hypothetical protein
MLKIDHVLLACQNVFLTADLLREETGLASVEGGYLKGLGLAQRIVPLGNRQFIEIESVVDAGEAAKSDRPISRHIMEITREQPKFLSSYLISDQVDAEIGRLGLEKKLAQITTPAGEVVKTWVAPRVDDAIQNGDVPIWCELDDDRLHPGDLPVKHAVNPTGFSWFEFGGSETHLREWIGAEVDSLPLRFVGGSPGLRALAIGLDDGSEIVLRPRAEGLAEPSSAPA